MSKFVSSLYKNVLVSTNEIESIYLKNQDEKAVQISDVWDIYFVTKSGKMFLMDVGMAYIDAVSKMSMIAYNMLHCESSVYEILPNKSNQGSEEEVDNEEEEEAEEEFEQEEKVEDAFMEDAS